jgi:hypothetical protein
VRVPTNSLWYWRSSSSFYSRPVPGGRWSAYAARAIGFVVLLVLTGCVSQAAPAPAAQRSTPPPWDAPRDAVSYIAAAGLEAQPLGSNENSHVVNLRITVDGAAVEVPPYVGIDRVRALQAPVHTHDSTGQVWLEGREIDGVTLGQFFTVWESGSMIIALDRHAAGSSSLLTAESARRLAKCIWPRVARSTSRHRPSTASYVRGLISPRRFWRVWHSSAI